MRRTPTERMEVTEKMRQTTETKRGTTKKTKRTKRRMAGCGMGLRWGFANWGWRKLSGGLRGFGLMNCSSERSRCSSHPNHFLFNIYDLTFANYSLTQCQITKRKC